ncbi:hypothetical protein KAH94_05915, partial [bacterium]|nr:hypothetical protein [bacterium]
MKISVAWIFDHIDADYKKININDLVNAFNKTTAEIEGFYSVSLNLDMFSLVSVKKINDKNITVFSSEWNKEIILTVRDDQKKSDVFLVKKVNDQYVWATLSDFHCEKDGFIPALTIEESLQSGAWKKQVFFDDYILEVDNKSITHRPDMWGHRGFAREIAAMFDLPLIPFEKLSVEKKIKNYDEFAPASQYCPIAITLKDQKVGKRFAAFFVESIENRPSSLHMAYRLAVTGNRPISMLVDVTNYVMLDISQPMHAFDAKQVPLIDARLAKKGEVLTLLDDKKLKLTNEDYVITDGKIPISLAGIMGGKKSGISDGTTSLLLESANFDATTIRKSAIRFKVRTEASARFEKTLDPNQNIDAISRFVYLLDVQGIQYKAADTIVSLGKKSKEHIIDIGYDFICKRLGVQIDSDFIIKTLEKIECKVEKKADMYQITVPTFRSTKDVTIPEDIVEELGRFFGYDNIPSELPKKGLAPSNIDSILSVREIKRLCA